ncbi:MAG: hypothetical protein J6S97_07230 [Bacteroidales bacterium]|nr:hypothetical protein [Bacteroidales bacterium]MBP5383058.1 hypothetical protein [Bacteroidales bacterium]
MKFRTVAVLIIAILLLAVGVLLLFATSTLKYGVILIGGVLLAFLVWKAFIKNNREELLKSEQLNEQLNHQLTELRRELDTLRHSPLNVASLTPVLHLSVLNVDTSFTRTYIREDKDRSLVFSGALRADICAEYGVRLEDVRFKYEPSSDTLYVAGFNPGVISYSRKRLTWDLCHTFRGRSLLGINLPPVNDKVAEDFTHKMTESIRNEVEAEIDNRRIKEFDWLEPVVSRQIIDVLRVAVCGPKTRINVLEGDAGEGFVGIDELYRSHAASAPQIQS